MTDAELDAIEKSSEYGEVCGADAAALVAEVRRLRAANLALVSEFKGIGSDVRAATLEEAAKVVENGRFLHDEAPAARLAREAAAAIRARKETS